MRYARCRGYEAVELKRWKHLKRSVRMSTLVRTRPCGAFYRGLLSTSRNLNISQLGCAALGIRPVNRRPKRAHPHCLLETVADKLFLALRWAPLDADRR
jgi:hypothetical protein